MASVLVRGRGGAVQRALADRLRALGVDVVSVGADAPGPVDAAVVVDLGRPGPGRRERLASALEGGAHVLAASLDPADAHWAADVWGVAAGERGLVVVPNAGMAAVLADVLAGLAAGAVDEVQEVHTAHLVAERGGLRRWAGTGARSELAELVGAATPLLDRGRSVPALPGEQRRLAWFSRPVGPRHAASVPSPEVATIPRHVPGLQAVSGSLAVSTWQAEALQALGNAAARDAVGARLRARVVRPARQRGDATGVRWALVAEARGVDGVARAWANGRDLAGTTAAVLAQLALRLVRGVSGLPGAPAPAELVDPATLLDALAVDVDLRWSVVRPASG